VLAQEDLCATYNEYDAFSRETIRELLVLCKWGKCCIADLQEARRSSKEETSIRDAKQTMPGSTQPYHMNIVAPTVPTQPPHLCEEGNAFKVVASQSSIGRDRMRDTCQQRFDRKEHRRRLSAVVAASRQERDA
jgi:hypothetical protein